MAELGRADRFDDLAGETTRLSNRIRSRLTGIVTATWAVSPRSPAPPGTSIKGEQPAPSGTRKRAFFLATFAALSAAASRT